MMPGGGRGGERRWEQDFWVWPLPPPGPLAFVCEWPAYRIALSRVEIEADLLRTAAADAPAIWPEDKPFAEIERPLRRCPSDASSGSRSRRSSGTA